MTAALTMILILPFRYDPIISQMVEIGNRGYKRQLLLPITWKSDTILRQSKYPLQYHRVKGDLT